MVSGPAACRVELFDGSWSQFIERCEETWGSIVLMELKNLLEIKKYFNHYLLDFQIHLFYKALLSTYCALVTILESGYTLVKETKTLP